MNVICVLRLRPQSTGTKLSMSWRRRRWCGWWHGLHEIILILVSDDTFGFRCATLSSINSNKYRHRASACAFWFCERLTSCDWFTRFSWWIYHNRNGIWNFIFIQIRVYEWLKEGITRYNIDWVIGFMKYHPLMMSATDFRGRVPIQRTVAASAGDEFAETWIEQRTKWNYKCMRWRDERNATTLSFIYSHCTLTRDHSIAFGLTRTVTSTND